MLRHMPEETTIHFRIECLLLNVAGLVPEPRYINDASSSRRARLLRRVWKKCRKHYRREVMVAAEWQFFRLRPGNFPTIRIAGAVQLAARFLGEDVLKSIIAAVKDRKSVV